METQYLVLPEVLFETSAADSFSGTVTIPEISMGSDSYRFAEPLDFDLFVTNTGGAFLVTGKVTGTADAQCARCLDDIKIDLDAEIEAYYLIDSEEQPLTEDEEVEYEVLEDKNKIDLTALCQAALALAIPLIPLCSEDCEGICPQCGANLNRESCTCEIQEEDDSNNPFAVLKNYKFGSEDSE